jgi:hypothetical protein
MKNINMNKIRENLKKELNGLAITEYQEIFNIIKKDTSQYTENKNGIFINLKNLNENTINKISHFINYCKHNKKNLEVLEEKQNEEIRNANINNNNKSYIINIDDANIMTSIDDISLKDKKINANESFTFQNFIDKFMITNMKMFPENKDERIIYPNLKQFKCNFTGVKYRLLKRCREISKSSTDKFMTPLFSEMEDGQLDNKNINDDDLDIETNITPYDNDNYDKSDDDSDTDDDTDSDNDGDEPR